MRKIVGIPRTKRIALAVTVGFPATSEIRAKNRKTLDQIRSYNSYTG
jgi:hypothetical protein